MCPYRFLFPLVYLLLSAVDLAFPVPVLQIFYMQEKHSIPQENRNRNDRLYWGVQTWDEEIILPDTRNRRECQKRYSRD